jgi:hypothetical protein
LPNLSLDIPWLVTAAVPHAKNKLDKELFIASKQKQTNQNHKVKTHN